MRITNKLLFLTGIFALVVLCGIVSAQNPTPTPVIDEEDDVIKVSSRLVMVPVSVVDANGDPILGLTAANFRIAEEGRNQLIENIGTADSVPLEIALLFDVSASTDKMFRFQQETASKFLREVLKIDDRASIFSIGITPQLIASSQPAENAIESVMAIPATREKEPTAFFDSIRFAADHLSKNTPQGRRKVIVVISDGEDNYSLGVQRAQRSEERKIVDQKVTRTDKDELRQLGSIVAKAQQTAKISEREKGLRALQNADIVLYSINPGGSSYHLNQISVFGQENMQKFADETGGTAFLPKFLPIDSPNALQNGINTKKNTEMLERIFRRLANELRAQYMVQYYSESEFPDGKFVKLKVDVTGQNTTTVRARQGYYVKN